MKSKITPLFLAFLGTLFLTSCDRTTGDKKVTLALDIESVFDGAAVSLDHSTHTTGFGESVKFTRHDYLLSNFVLTGGSPNEEFALRNVFGFVRGSNGVTRIFLDSIPVGNYTGLRFTVGLDSAANHSDPTSYGPTHPLNPAVNSLHWGWAGGYIFTALEGRYIHHNSTDEGVFLYHMALDENAFTVEVPVVLDLSRRDKVVQLKYNLAEIFKNPTLFSIEERGDFSHSTADNGIVQLLIGNMSDVFTAQKVENL